MPKLIPHTKITRSFGFDTTQTAIGRLPSEDAVKESSGELRLSPTEFRTIMKLMIKAVAASAAKPLLVLLPVNNTSVAHEVTISCKRDDADHAADLTATREFDAPVRCKSTGHGTRMIVRLQKDTNNAYWLNVRANPTNLINGYNALGVALDGVDRVEERRVILRVPFGMLRAILRDVDPDFEWEKGTRGRIKRLQFKACPVQVFTYGATAPFRPHQFLGFLRALLACPMGDGFGHYCLVSDLLGIEVDSKIVGGAVQSLLLRIRQGGRISWSVNLYDKEAAATADAALLRLQVGSDRTRAFLRDRVRLDVTLHDGALRDLMVAAKLGRKRSVPLTAAHFSRAINRLNRHRGKNGLKFVPWMLHQIFGVLLPLTKLCNYRPSLVNEVRAAVARNGEAAVRAFDLWRENQFRFLEDGHNISFVQFAMDPEHGQLTRQTARTIQKTAAKVCLDLDVPLMVYDALYIMRHYFDLGEDDRRALAVALEAKDGAASRKLMALSKASSAATGTRLAKMLAVMIEGASVPAIELAAPTTKARRLASPRQ